MVVLLWKLVPVPFKHSASRASYQQTLRTCWSLRSYSQPQKCSYPTAQVLFSILDLVLKLHHLFVSLVSQVSLLQNTVMQFDLDFSILLQKTSAKSFLYCPRALCTFQSQALLNLSFFRYFWDNDYVSSRMISDSLTVLLIAIWHILSWCCPSHTALQGLVGGAVGANYEARTAHWTAHWIIQTKKNPFALCWLSAYKCVPGQLKLLCCRSTVFIPVTDQQCYVHLLLLLCCCPAGESDWFF